MQLEKNSCREYKGLNRSNLIKCIVIAFLILIGVNIPYVNLIALLLACFFIFKGTAGETAELLFFVLTFSTIFKLHPEGKTLFNVLIAAAIVKFLFLKPHLKLEIRELLALLAFVSYVLIFGGTNAMVKLTSLTMYFVLMLLLFKQQEKIELRSLLLFFSLGIVLSSLAALNSRYIPGLTSFIQYARLKIGDGEYLYRFCGLHINPNFYTMDISIALAGWFGMVVGRRTKLIDYVFIVALSVLGIMSISKSFLVMYAVLLLLVLISFGKQNIGGLMKGVFMIGLLIALIYVFADKEYMHAYLNRLLRDRSSDASLSTITTGRYDLWMGYLDHIFSDLKLLLFGEGLRAQHYALRPSHNYFIETVYYLGLVGSALYCLCIRNIFPERDLSVKRSFVNYLPLIILLVRGMAINLIMRENLIFYYIMIAVMLNTDLQRIKKEDSTEAVSFQEQQKLIKGVKWT